MNRRLVHALAACLTVGPGLAERLPPKAYVPRPCGPERAVQCDAPENDAPLPPWSDDVRRRVHEDCHGHMMPSIFPRWWQEEAEHIARFYCDCLVDYAEQAMPEREAFAESALSTYTVARAVCAMRTVRKYPTPSKAPPVNPFHT